MTGPLQAFPFVLRHMEKSPELFSRHQNLTHYQLQQDWLDYQSHHSHTDIYALLRRFRQSRLALIGFLDWKMPVHEHLISMHLVSALADLLVQQAYAAVDEEMCQRYGSLQTADGKCIELCVYALGKLGAQELNYSSDIDLVFVYDVEGESTGDKVISAAQWCERFGRKLIHLLETVTADGFVYRVDMRLRPFGNAGPLVVSRDAFFHYLHQEGREWERLAWMRARRICGQHIDNAVFAQELQSFIYRRHLDYSILSALAEIKAEMQRQANAALNDLKFGPGGIREIEFIVQSMQLIFGGRHKQVRGHAFSQQMQLLTDAGFMDAECFQTVSSGWWFLRRLENLSQLQKDQSVHELPEAEEDLSALAHVMDYESSRALLEAFRSHQQSVAGVFKRLFEQFQTTTSASDDDMLQAEALIAEATSSRLDSSTKEIIKKLCVKIVQHNQDPKVLLHMGQLLRAINRRPSYLMMLNQEPLVLERLLYLFSSHTYFVDVLIKHPLLLEFLFEHQAVQEFTDADALAQRWHKRNPQQLDEEAWLEEIRIFRQAVLLQIMQAYCEETLTVEKTTDAIAQLAVFLIAQTIRKCWADVHAKYSDMNIKADDLVVIAYGSVATQSMHPNSDLDLVFLFDVDALKPEQYAFLQKWVRRIMHALTANTYHGRLYDIDMRLRPNGQSGALLSGLEEFERYQLEQAWTWEHAALIKTDAIYATADQRQWFQQARQKILGRRFDADEVDADLRDIAERMQTGSNKNHQLEFELLALVLKNAVDIPELLSKTRWSELIDLLAQHDYIDSETAQLWLHYFSEQLKRKLQ